MLQDIVDFLASEHGKQLIEIGKNAALAAGWVLVIARSLYGRVFTSSPEVRKLVDGLKEANTDVWHIPAAEHTPASPKYNMVAVLSLPNSKVAVYDKPTTDQLNECVGVVFHDTVDQSSLFDSSELRRIVKAAQDRRKIVEAEHRATKRKAFASKVPDPRPDKKA